MVKKRNLCDGSFFRHMENLNEELNKHSYLFENNHKNDYKQQQGADKFALALRAMFSDWNYSDKIDIRRYCSDLNGGVNDYISCLRQNGVGNNDIERIEYIVQRMNAIITGCF